MLLPLSPSVISNYESGNNKELIVKKSKTSAHVVLDNNFCYFIAACTVIDCNSTRS